MTDISIFIVNYNTAQLTKQCIESLLMQRRASFEIIVVDNHSSDESLSILHQFGTQMSLLANKDNKGFGKANNQAFHQSKGRYLFMLNPDAHCLTELDLFHAIHYMDQHPECGLAGTRIINTHHQVEHTSFDHYPRQSETKTDFSKLPGKIASVLGASMIVRRDVFEKINGFDEDYFLYAEETDLCLRIRKQGYSIGYCDDVTVCHVGGASEKKHAREDVIRKKKAGKLLFYSKHYLKSDVLKMMKRDFRLAQFHLILLELKKILFGLNKKQEQKYQKHRITLEIARRYLAE